MGGVLVMKLVLISSLVLSCCSSLQLNHPRFQGNETDRLALLEIKAQIQHDPNRVTSSWNETLHFCQWYGVACSRRHRQRVTKLELDALALVGSISPHVGNLSFLRVLNLQNNSFTHQIPPQIGNLHRLQWSITKLKEAFPQTWAMLFPTFNGLILAGINLLGLSHGRYPMLQTLSRLYVQKTSSRDLINATRLSLLRFDNNNFGGTFPTSIFNLSTNLQVLEIGGNYLQGSIPTGLENLVNLQVLAMEGNNFSGSIPTDIGKLSRLGQLSLNSNKLSGSIPSSLGNLTMLNLLNLKANNFSGSIPSSLGECHRLIVLDLSQNSLEGNIPDQLLTGLLSLSIVLNLSSNHFTGSLPVEIGKLKALGRLDISNNMLSGELPSSLGSCQSLEVLYLQGNFFNGSIPSSMQELRGIRDLDLSHNNFSGGIPQFLENLNLEHLNLSFNQLWGAVPTDGVFKNASATSVAGNTRLCGGIANLRLPVCKSDGSKGGGLSRRMKLMISLVSGFTLLGLVVVLSLFLLCKKRKETKPSPLGNSILQVSYATLLKATDGFSSANLIGVGAFGSVYKGVLGNDGVAIAVKVLNMLHRGASKSFLAECEALRKIRHRNLVKILTSCSSIDFNGNDFKALVYEFMDNGSLEEWLHPSNGTEEVRKAPLSVIQRLNIAIDVASALDYLHNHCETPIVHCDLKPSNVLLDKDLTGHVSDFGLSKFLLEPRTSGSGNQSSSIGIRGSVGYAAPEYGMGSDVSAQGDIYSFGILLLEMFTGKRPTDHMFSDGLNLHNYVKTSFPELVLEISESLLLQEGAINVSETHKHSRLSVRAQKVEECLTLILGVGVACSEEYPTNRKDISDAASELQSMRRNLLG